MLAVGLRGFSDGNILQIVKLLNDFTSMSYLCGLLGGTRGY